MPAPEMQQAHEPDAPRGRRPGRQVQRRKNKAVKTGADRRCRWLLPEPVAPEDRTRKAVQTVLKQGQPLLQFFRRRGGSAAGRACRDFFPAVVVFFGCGQQGKAVRGVVLFSEEFVLPRGGHGERPQSVPEQVAGARRLFFKSGQCVFRYRIARGFQIFL